MKTNYTSEGNHVYTKVMHKDATVKDKLFINHMLLEILGNQEMAIPIARMN